MKTRFNFRSIFGLTFCIFFAAAILPSCDNSTDSTYMGNWVRTSDFSGVGRYGATSFVLNDEAYVVCGYNSGEGILLRDCWKFDVNNKRWLQMADFPGDGRVYAFGFASNGKGYVGCGWNNKLYSKYKDVWEFNPAEGAGGKWTRVEDFADSTVYGRERYGCTSFTIGNVGYVCGGYNNFYLNELWAYDATKPLGSRWERKADLPKKRRDAQAFVIDNIAYVLGGNNNNVNPTDLYAYNPSTNTWEKKRDIYDATSDDFDNDYVGIAREQGVTFVINGFGYLSLGQSSSTLSTTWEYQPDKDVWVKKTDFEGAARVGAVGFTVANRGFIATGKASNTTFDDVWEFEPFKEKNTSDNQ